MTTQLIVHIGDYKTGSTSIQHCLRTQRFEIPDRTILFPGGTDHHMTLAQSIRTATDSDACRALSISIADEIRQSDADITVLSAEHFQDLRPRQLQNWMKTYLPELAGQARLIGYVRPHADYILSMFAEQTKLGVEKRMLDAYVQAWLPKQRMNFCRRFKRWHTIYGNRFTLRPMVRDVLVHQDVVHDFRHYGLGYDGPPMTGLPPRENRSLCLEDLEFMRRVHELLRRESRTLKLQDRRRVGNILYTALSATTPKQSTPLRFTKQQVAAMQDTYGHDARRLDKLFFDGNPMASALDEADRLVGKQPDLSGKSSLRQKRALMQALVRMPPSLRKRVMAGVLLPAVFPGPLRRKG